MVSAMVREKALQIDLKNTLRVLGKPNGAQKLFLGILPYEGGVMDAAEVDEIQRSSSHDEHGLKVGAGRVVLGPIGYLRQIVQDAATVGELELADAYGLFLHQRFIRQKIGVEGYVTFQTKLLLMELRLNG